MAILENCKKPRGYIDITPKIVAIFSLKDCEEQLRRASAEKLRLAQALKSAYLAIQAALIAALSGPMDIGAHAEKLRKKKLEYYQNGIGERPADDRVLPFEGLLKRAMDAPLALTLSDVEQKLLTRLCCLRNNIEHPKQTSSSIEIAYILEVLPVAARTAVKLLGAVAHQLEPGVLDELNGLATQIEMHCHTMQAPL